MTLVKNGGAYTITQVDGTKINFNLSGKINSIVDINDNATNFTYTNAKLSSITDASNREVSINYGTNGYVSSISTPGSRTLNYEYDANGNISSVVTNAGTISYQYDELNQLTQETLLDGTIISYEYDAVGNRTKKTVNISGNITTTKLHL